MTDSSSLYLTSGSNLYILNGKADLTNSDLEINTGNLTVNNGTISGSFVGDGAGLYNIPSSGITGLNLDRIVSGSVSASLADGKLKVNTDVVIDGTITAKELRIDYVTSSILYQSGSTKFGDTLDDNHNFTGSLRTTGSVIIDGDLTVRGTTTLTSTDPLRESLIISGAMAMMQAQIQSQIISASISMGGQRVISQEQNNIVLDLGGF
jgi:cytoskeletal protein CcmA (bactofilin family)